MHDEAKDSQQDAQQDSALQTPQPDQPHPPLSGVDNERDDSADDSPPVEVDVSVPEGSEGVEVAVDNPAAPQTESD